MDKKKKEFDYYIYLDYSENLIGYIIIKREMILEVLSKISKLDHYRKVEHKREYISAAKNRFERDKIKDLLLKWKIKEIRLNLDVFADVVKFVEEKNNSIDNSDNYVIKNSEFSNRTIRKTNDTINRIVHNIFLSIDDNQYYGFRRLLTTLKNRKNLLLVKESNLKKGTIEHKLSLIIDNILNIERRKR